MALVDPDPDTVQLQVKAWLARRGSASTILQHSSTLQDKQWYLHLSIKYSTYFEYRNVITVPIVNLQLDCLNQ
jgi:hypothetical protein